VYGAQHQFTEQVMLIRELAGAGSIPARAIKESDMSEIRMEHDVVDDCYSIFDGERKVAMVKKMVDAEAIFAAYTIARRNFKDQEIEALAEKIMVHSHLKWNDDHGMDAYQSAYDAFHVAEDFINARDKWRKAREQ
jgi:hypothetical protein